VTGKDIHPSQAGKQQWCMSALVHTSTVEVGVGGDGGGGGGGGGGSGPVYQINQPNLTGEARLDQWKYIHHQCGK
jgi:hypothetical protein